MNSVDAQFKRLISKILEEGEYRDDRTGVGRISIFGEQLRFNLQEGFPLLTLKKTHFKSIVHELLWFLSGSTNVKYLQENGVTIWDEWCDPEGNLGPIYGKQWVDWSGYDAIGKVTRKPTVVEAVKYSCNQIAILIHELIHNPNSSRHIVSVWNVGDLEDMALPPCHYTFDCFVSNSDKLSLRCTMRSVDTFLGLPFNITSYALLTHMLAQVCGYRVGDLVMSLGDTHLYQNHVEQAKEVLTRESFALPNIRLNPEVKDIFQFKYEDVELIGYQSNSTIKAPIAV